MEIIEQNDKPIDEIEKLLLLPYHGKKADYVIKSMKKRLKKLFSETFSTQIKFTNKIRFVFPYKRWNKIRT